MRQGIDDDLIREREKKMAGNIYIMTNKQLYFKKCPTMSLILYQNIYFI